MYAQYNAVRYAANADDDRECELEETQLYLYMIICDVERDRDFTCGAETVRIDYSGEMTSNQYVT